METGSSTELFCLRFSLAEIQSATQNFDEALVIGRGGFGKVYKGAINNGSNTIIAAFKRLHSTSNQGPPELRAQVEMLSKPRHSHLVSLIGYCNDGAEMVLVYEYMPRGTLEDLLHRAGPPLSWLQRLKICVGAARGLDYLHTGQGVIHRDVKSSNILLDENFAAKISDFGVAKLISPTKTHVTAGVKGTFGYLDPSYVHTGKLTRQSDVYSFGVVLLQVLCGRPAVDTSLDEYGCGLAPWAQDRIKGRKLGQIIDPRLEGQISSNSLKKFASIACDCLNYLPNKRPTTAEIVTGLELVLSLEEKTRLSASEGNFFGKVRAYFSSAPKVNSVVSYLTSGEPSGKSNDKLADAVVTIGEAKAALGHKKNQQVIPFSFTPIDDAVIERNGVSSASDEMTRMDFNQLDNWNQLVSVRLDKWNGKKCYMLGARELSIAWQDDPRYWDWGSIPESRFPEVAMLENVYWLEIRGKIGSMMLSYKTIYAAYLIFQIEENSWGLAVPGRTIVKYGGTEIENSNVYLKKPGASPANVHWSPWCPTFPSQENDRFPHKRKDGWMEIELGEFYCDEGDNDEVEMAFVEVRHGHRKSGLIVEGIELRPKKNRFST